MSKTMRSDVEETSPSVLSVETQEKLLKVVMRRQAALSLRVGALFLLPLLALPWINQSQAATMNSRLFGFSITWLLLGIVIFPLTWFVSAYFVHKSDSIEAECTAIGREMLPALRAQNGGVVMAQEEGTE